MSGRMNYGKRFHGNGIAGGPRFYDPRTDVSLNLPVRLRNLDEVDRMWAGLKGSAQNSANHSGCYLANRVEIDEHYEAEKRMRDRISACVDVLNYGLQELMAAPPPLKGKPGIKTLDGDREELPNMSVGAVIKMMDQLCKLIGREPPHWGVERAPVGTSALRRCIECGTELTATEKERCNMCEENSFKNYKQEELEAARAERARQREIARTAKAMAMVLTKIQKKRRKDYAGHRRHSGEDVGPVDPGGSGQDQRLGGEAAPGDSAGDPRHAQSRDDGVASEPDAHPGSASEAAPA